MQNKIIKVNSSDNVAVALVNLNAGEVISFEGEKSYHSQNLNIK